MDDSEDNMEDLFKDLFQEIEDFRNSQLQLRFQYKRNFPRHVIMDRALNFNLRKALFPHNFSISRYAFLLPLFSHFSIVDEPKKSNV